MKLYCIIALSLLLRPETAAAQQEELMGIGTGQLQMFVELAVHKSGFNQSLAIVERTIDLNSRDILP